MYKRDSRSVVAARKHCTKRQSQTLTILYVLSAHMDTHKANDVVKLNVSNKQIELLLHFRVVQSNILFHILTIIVQHNYSTIINLGKLKCNRAYWGGSEALKRQ